jgi:hypothetical protein
MNNQGNIRHVLSNALPEGYGAAGLGSTGSARGQSWEELVKHQAALQQTAAQQCAQDKPRQGEILEKIERLFDRADGLENRIGRLASRLDRVLMPSPANENGCGKACAPSATAMGDQLAQLTDRLERMIDAIDAIHARLEL